jgi:hypothetical protein
LAGPDADRSDDYRGREAKFPAKDHDSLLEEGHGFLLAKAVAERQVVRQVLQELPLRDAHQKAVVAGAAASAGPVVADVARVAAVEQQAAERLAPSAGPEEDSPDESE